MNEITHRQAKRYLRADLDGLLSDAQRRALETHLAGCEACRAESQSLSSLTSRLQSEFHSRWDTQDGPSERVLKNIRSQSRRIKMQKRIDVVFNLLGGTAALVLLFFVVTSVISRFQKDTAATNGTQVPAPAQPESLIAFVLVEKDSKPEIYTMKSDGSERTNITDDPATDEFPAWSPDGKQIAFVSDRSGGRDIYLMNSDGSNVRKLTDSSTFNEHFFWSPDGTRIAYLSSESGEGSISGTSHLMVMNADGSNKMALTSEPGSYTIFGWSPDGQNIVYKDTHVENNRERVMVASADGINTLDEPFFEGDGGRKHDQIHWESSEQFITISSNRDRPAWGMWTLTRFYTIENYTNSINANPVLVSSDFPIVAIFDKTYVIENKDSLVWLTYQGAPIPYKPWNFSEKCAQPNDPFVEDSAHVISPDGQQAFVTIHCGEGVTWFYLENSDGSQFVQLTNFSIANPATVSGINWSPDGKAVVVTIPSAQGTNLYRFDIQEMLNDPSTQPVPLTTDDTVKYWAIWQPVVKNEVVENTTTEPEKTSSKNRLLAFTVVEEGGNTEIYTMNADGSHLSNITNHEALDSNPAWSPDGKRIAFESNRAAFTQIYLMDADGSNVTQLTLDEIEHEMTMNYAISNPWSPDGSHLLFFHRVYPEKGAPPVPLELYSIDINGGNEILLASGDITLFDVSWSPDGKHIAYSATDPQNPNANRIYVVDANGSDPIEITKSLHPNEQVANFNYYWSSDSQSLIFIAMNEKSQQWFAYEAFLDGGPLVPKTRANSTLGGWWNDTSFIIGFRNTLTWARNDGTINVLEVSEKCRLKDGLQYSWLYKRSNKGNFLIGVDCPEENLWFYYVNSNGTEVRQLFNSQLSGDIVDVVWSPDDNQAIAIISGDTDTNLYLFDIHEMLNDPSTQPAQLTTDGVLKEGVTWQPQP